MDITLKSQFLSLYCMVLADGIIDARELETLYKIGIEQYDLTQSEITDTIRNAGTSFVMPSTLEGKIQFLYNMAQIAYADGEIDATERNLLKRYVSKMDFEEYNIDAITTFLLDSVKDGIAVNDIIKSVTNK